jgi:uncharacterized protein (DUF58 family)
LVKKSLKVDSSTNFLVRPQLFELPAIRAAAGSLTTTHRRSRTSRRGSDEFYALRPYVLGDDLRKVHWRAAAKSDDLLVRQEKETQLGAITIVLDCAPNTYDNPGFERAVSAACSILHAAFKGDDLVKFYTSDSPNPQVVEDSQTLESIEKRLALLNPDHEANLPKILQSLAQRSVGGSLIVIFGVPNTKLSTAIENCRFKHKQVIPICCNPVDGQKSFSFAYDGRTPLPVLWKKALTVSAK